MSLTSMNMPAINTVRMPAGKSAEVTMDWIVVVDDDKANLIQAGQILSSHAMRVTALKSGPALLDFVKTNKPDLILLEKR